MKEICILEFPSNLGLHDWTPRFLGHWHPADYWDA